MLEEKQEMIAQLTGIKSSKKLLHGAKENGRTIGKEKFTIRNHERNNEKYKS